MDGFFLPLLLAPLGLIVAAILGAIAFGKVKQLEQRVAWLEFRLQQQAVQQSKVTQTAEHETKDNEQAEAFADDASEPLELTPPIVAYATSAATTPAAITATARTANVQTPSSPFERLINNVREHWMVWLGGACVGLAGVFMVRYSIEQQLLGPAARLILAALAGFTLHGLAEWLRRRKGASPSFAALAGGASIILYASLFGAFRLLENPSAGWIFVGMALVSLATMLLALRQGPMLAALGMLGGYLVPLLVNTGSGKMEYALIYALIISLFTLWLKAYVQKQWLWQGAAIGGLVWWLISFTGSPSFDIRSAYLVVLLYLLVAVPAMDWRLRLSTATADHDWWTQLKTIWQHSAAKQLWLAALAIVIAQGVTWWAEDIGHVGYLSLLLMPMLLAQLALRRPEFNGLLALMLALTSLCWLLYVQGVTPEVEAIGLRLLALTALYMAVAWLWYQRVNQYQSFWLALGCAAPLMMLAAAFYQLDFIVEDWAWALTTLVLGLLLSYMALSWQRIPQAMSQVVLFSAAHVAYSLAAVMLLQDASLTMALSVQMLSLTWLLRRYQLVGLGWALRLVLVVVLIRLTLNPWLLNYGDNNLWIPWIYSTAFACALASAYWLKDQVKLQPWLVGGGAQLGVLMLMVWVRWWLYDGKIYQSGFSFNEASIYVSSWGAIALLYQWRSQHTAYASRFYHWLAILHGGAALLLYANYLLLSRNPLWAKVGIESTPIWNMLLLAYGVPSVLLAGWAWQVKRGYWPAVWLLPVSVFAALSAWFFISIEIRHLWNMPNNLWWHNGTKMGELYTYSAIWLLAAVGALVMAMLKNSLDVYRGGIVLLLVVVAKIFFVDMSGLTGLWRVASFMGLGLTLLALAWMHQRYGKQLASH